MKLPQPRKIIAEKYVAGLSLFKSRRSPIKLSANESALGPSPRAVKSYSSIGKGFVRYPDSDGTYFSCLLYTSPSPRDLSTSRMPSSA